MLSDLELLLTALLKGEEYALLQAYKGCLSSPLMTSLLDAVKGSNKPYKPLLASSDGSVFT